MKSGYFFLISAVIHFALIATLFFLPGYTYDSRRIVNIVEVDLVSPINTQTEKTVQTPKKTKTAKTTKKPHEKKAIKKAVKKVPVAKKADPKKAEIKQKETEENQMANVSESIERIKKEINDNAPKKEANEANQTIDRQYGFSSGGKIANNVTSLYQAEIAYKIQQNWIFSEQIAGEKKDLKTLLVITIMKNGEVKNIGFKQRSGNRYYDESAYKAVMKASPLPRLPEAFQTETYKVGLAFTPSGIE